MILSDLFNIHSGISATTLFVSESIESENHIPLIRPTSNFKNAIVGYVDKREVNEKFIFSEQTIFVSTNGAGSHTYSYVSNFEFIPNSDVVALVPKLDLTINEKVYYAMCITKNRYRFSYGRKPKGERLANIELPSREEIPAWVYEMEPPTYDNIVEPAVYSEPMDLNTVEWKEFYIGDVFNLSRGVILPKKDLKDLGEIALICTSANKNGILGYIEDDSEIKFKKQKNVISISMDGSVGKCFYQEKWCIPNNITSILIPKPFVLNKYVALFLIPILEKERFRYSYGRKLSQERFLNSKIKLPINLSGEVNVEFMESYIKSLRFSSQL